MKNAVWCFTTTRLLQGAVWSCDLSVSVKKIEFFFKRYLEYEKKHGTPQTIQAVKEKAVEFVEAGGNEAANGWPNTHYDSHIECARGLQVAELGLSHAPVCKQACGSRLKVPSQNDPCN